MNQAVTAIILAGGRGSRMGGIDKGLMDFDGAPIVSRVIERINPQVDRLLISANRNLETYRSLGFPVYSDQLNDYQGPLAGVISTALHADTPLLLTTPCDTPNLPLDLCNKLQQSLTEHNARIAIANDGERNQQLCMLFHTELLDDMNDYLNCGNRSVKGWLENHNPAVSVLSEVKNAFLNINEPAALRP